MPEMHDRTRRLLGEDAVTRLSAARVAVFGIGGVGGAVVEALARAGVGALDVFDADVVTKSNLNRQILATRDVLGMDKTQAAVRRVKAINPQCVVTPHTLLYLPETADTVDVSVYDFVVDAVDTVSAKIELAVRCQAAGVPLVASMGTGNKLDPTAFRVTDIYKTTQCPLARVMRRELRARGVTALPVVWSDEPPAPLCGAATDSDAALTKRNPPASVSFVPPVAGYILAGYVIRRLTGC